MKTKKTKIIGRVKKGEPIDCKRMYFPGIKISVRCPECQHKGVKDLGQNCIYYPVIGEAMDMGFYCSKCEHEWMIPIVIDLTLRLA
jgi:hypothetical protein